MIYSIFKLIAFRLDPEIVHDFSFFLCHHFSGVFSHASVNVKKMNDFISDKYEVKGNCLNWNNPIGLAAGLDKNSYALDFLSRLGFGALEIGTVTPKAQSGNPRPRIFRYIKKESLRNYMGFPNEGADTVYNNLSNFKAKNSSAIPIGVNLGKNSDTPNEDACKDYYLGYKKFVDIADYLVINISCPNVNDLTKLQGGDNLKEILKYLAPIRAEKPGALLIKIGPDLLDKEITEIVKIAQEYSLAGIIATNTINIPALGKGGISGKLLSDDARKTRNFLLKEAQGTKLDIVGVGGISSFSEIDEFFKNGGKFIQIYTSFIYQGPEILLTFKSAIDNMLNKGGFNNLMEYFKKI